jgi:hypothetical protein
MTMTWAASIAVALGLLTLPGAAFEAVGKSPGVASHPTQPPKSAPAPHPGAPGHHRVFRRFPIFGVAAAPYYVAPDYGSDDLVEATAPPPEPPTMLTCKRREEVVIVPSRDGGTREVRITRC